MCWIVQILNKLFGHHGAYLGLFKLLIAKIGGCEVTTWHLKISPLSLQLRHGQPSKRNLTHCLWEVEVQFSSPIYWLVLFGCETIPILQPPLGLWANKKKNYVIFVHFFLSLNESLNSNKWFSEKLSLVLLLSKGLSRTMRGFLANIVPQSPPKDWAV